MASFTGRRPPNVSQYIANLNTIPSAHDIAQQQQQEGYGIDDDLAIFTNAEFFDFDMGENIEQPAPYDATLEGRARRENAGSKPSQMKNVDFTHAADFQYPEIGPYVATDPANTSPPHPLQAQFPAPVLTTPPNMFNPSGPISASPTVGEKRTFDGSSMSPSSSGNVEHSSRFAAEEDKRRRNTAASARFRVKKKQREQALERQAKEVTERAEALESRIGQLETENKWLRSLLVEKNASGHEEVSEAESKIKDVSRSKETVKKGVGTAVKAKGEEDA
ncbi:hypothetical protein MMC09_005368 [Bachmanniomyces sp. S44760]|nr:hypothetical protein [Bachmanniomyces sp. S44760]